jgi:hypothetical protein
VVHLDHELWGEVKEDDVFPVVVKACVASGEWSDAASKGTLIINT